MYKVYFLLSLVILSSCGTSKFIGNRVGCRELLKNDFRDENIDLYKIETSNKSVFYHQLKFFCVGNHGYTQKLMYNQFGVWTDAYALTADDNRMLVWKNVDLFSDGKKYSVYASGLDDQYGPLYASVMVFDENEKDMLAADSNVQESLIVYFSDKIRELDDSIDFAREYWTTFNPKTWEVILKRYPSYN